MTVKNNSVSFYFSSVSVNAACTSNAPEFHISSILWVNKCFLINYRVAQASLPDGFSLSRGGSSGEPEWPLVLECAGCGAASLRGKSLVICWG